MNEFIDKARLLRVITRSVQYMPWRLLETESFKTQHLTRANINNHTFTSSKHFLNRRLLESSVGELCAGITQDSTTHKTQHQHENQQKKQPGKSTILGYNA